MDADFLALGAVFAVAFLVLFLVVCLQVEGAAVVVGVAAPAVVDQDGLENEKTTYSKKLAIPFCFTTSLLIALEIIRILYFYFAIFHLRVLMVNNFPQFGYQWMAKQLFIIVNFEVAIHRQPICTLASSSSVMSGADGR